jgi:hypothetical protein
MTSMRRSQRHRTLYFMLRSVHLLIVRDNGGSTQRGYAAGTYR